MQRLFGTMLAVLAGVQIASPFALAADTREPHVRTESFDQDPGWDAFNNRMKPDAGAIREVVQDFGYSPTAHAGGQPGELGGQVFRATQQAFYADKIPVKTLNDKLTASGKFSFDPMGGGGGIWFGWFLAQQEVGNARPKNGLGLNFDFERDGGRLAVRMSNQKNEFCGTFVTPYIPGRFRPSPLHPHTPYEWTLTYDPQAGGGNGQFQFTLRSLRSDETTRALDAKLQAAADALPAEQRAMFGPKVGRPDYDGKTFVVDLPPGFKQTGATFDHFGLLAGMKEGNPVKVYFDDLKYDGKSEDFAKDPKWDGSGNRQHYAEDLPTGYHDFGFSPETHLAGGSPGEMGGTFWRLTKAYGYYADRIGPLTLNDPLEASGRLTLLVGSPDSEMAFGWFNSSQRDIPHHLKNGKQQEGHLDKSDNFLGVYLAGPSRLGRCLQPAVITDKGTRRIFNNVDRAPRPAPGQSYQWTLKYDPAGADGNGTLTVTLGEATATLTLDRRTKEEGARFDRFGFFPSGGGGMVRIYFDDLRYTAGR